MKKIRWPALIIGTKFVFYRALSWALAWRYGRRREYRGWACILRNDALGDFFLSWPPLAGLADYFHARGVPVVILASERMCAFIAATGKFDAVVPADARIMYFKLSSSYSYK